MSRIPAYNAADLQPHDLLWGMSPEQLTANAPDWARERLALGDPVVVRRDASQPEQVAVGVRGLQRGQRFAGWMPASQVARRVQPEQIRQLNGAGTAVQATLDGIGQVFFGMAWGITGSHAFEALTGVKVTRAASDLDILLRLPELVSPEQAAGWLQQLAGLPVRVDIQVESGLGGFSLRDWAGRRGRVLLKTGTGALLTDNPWQTGGVA